MKANQTLSALAIFFLTIAAAPQAAVTSPKPTQDQPKIAVVPVYLSAFRPLAVLRIGDHPPAPVVFDTGTSGNALDSDYASYLKLDYDPDVDVQVVDGSTGKAFIARQAKLPIASLGNVPISEKTATTYPYKERDVVGIFGPNSFIGRLLFMDFGSGRVIAKDKIGGAPASLGRPTPYLGTGNRDALPAIDVQLPGMTVRALMDSGNTSELFLPRKLAAKLPLKGPLKLAGKASGASGEESDFYEGQLRGEIRIGSVTLKDPVVKFHGIHPNVGLPILRKLTIALDPEGQRSWIVKAPHLTRQQLTAFAGRYGIRSLRVAGDTLVYQREGRRPFKVRYIGEDMFSVDETGDVLQFWRDGGRVVRMDHVGNGGTLTRASKAN